MTVLTRGRSRFVLIATVLGMVAALAVLVSSPGASGQVQAPTTIEADAGVILVGTGDGETWIRYYEHPDAPLDVDAYDAEQTVSVSSKCAVTTDGSLLAISETGGRSGVGHVSNGYGVRAKNNCATSEGRVGDGQTLTFELGSFFGSDIEIVLGELDIEGKHAADLAYSAESGQDTHSATVDLPNTSDNGPDSGVGDNSLAVVDPPMNFTSITFSPDGSGNAEIAVEGGGDGIVPGGAERTALGVNQSLFKLVSIQAFDGELDCNESSEGTAPPEEEGPAEAILLSRGDNLKGQECDLVPFTFRNEADSVLFDTNTEEQENANFLIRIDWDPDVTPIDPFNTPHRQIMYFPDTEFEPVVACVRLLDEGEDMNPEPDANDVYEHPEDPRFEGGVVPWCLAGERLDLLESGAWQQIQWYDGAEDPRFK